MAMGVRDGTFETSRNCDNAAMLQRLVGLRPQREERHDPIAVDATTRTHARTHADIHISRSGTSE